MTYFKKMSLQFIRQTEENHGGFPAEISVTGFRNEPETPK
jgi:hypothetical protein